MLGWAPQAGHAAAAVAAAAGCCIRLCCRQHPDAQRLQAAGLLQVHNCCKRPAAAQQQGGGAGWCVGGLPPLQQLQPAAGQAGKRVLQLSQRGRWPGDGRGYQRGAALLLRMVRPHSLCRRGSEGRGQAVRNGWVSTRWRGCSRFMRS